MQGRLSPGAGVQIVSAVALLSFSAVALAAPQVIVEFGVRDAFQDGRPLVAVAIMAMGLHALCSGAFALVYPFKPATFPGFALSLLPFAAVDWWLYAKAMAFNEFALVHAAGILTVSLLCVFAYFAQSRFESGEEQEA